MGAMASDQEAVYPQRPVTLVTVTHPVAVPMLCAASSHVPWGKFFGQKMIVQYKPGAAGNIGAEYVARTTPDGYTVFLGGRPNTIHKTMYERMKI